MARMPAFVRCPLGEDARPPAEAGEDSDTLALIDRAGVTLPPRLPSLSRLRPVPPPRGATSVELPARAATVAQPACEALGRRVIAGHLESSVADVAWECCALCEDPAARAALDRDIDGRRDGEPRPITVERIRTSVMCEPHPVCAALRSVASPA